MASGCTFYLIKKAALSDRKIRYKTELLIEGGDMGVNIRFVKIKTIYSENGSHIRPIADVPKIAAYIISYIHIEWLIEGVTSNKQNIYSAKVIKET